MNGHLIEQGGVWGKAMLRNRVTPYKAQQGMVLVMAMLLALMSSIVILSLWEALYFEQKAVQQQSTWIDEMHQALNEKPDCEQYASNIAHPFLPDTLSTKQTQGFAFYTREGEKLGRVFYR